MLDPAQVSIFELDFFISSSRLMQHFSTVVLQRYAHPGEQSSLLIEGAVEAAAMAAAAATTTAKITWKSRRPSPKCGFGLRQQNDVRWLDTTWP